MRPFRRAAAEVRLAALVTLVGLAGLVGAGFVMGWAVAAQAASPALQDSAVLQASAAGEVSAAGQAGPAAAADPAMAAPGANVTFTVSCGSATDASAMLLAQPLGLAAQIPMEAATSAPGHFSIAVALPGGIRPGTYHPHVACSDGTSAPVTLRISELAAADGVRTHAGTSSSAANTGLMVGGVVLICVGAVAGGLAIRRYMTAA
jgi:hypothetical protein